MIGGDQLFNLERRLDDLSTRSPQEIEELCEVLRGIYQTPSYQTWLNSSSPAAVPYQLEPTFGIGVRFEMRRLLDSTGLVNGSTLEVKVDEHIGRIHITDGPWVPGSVRVYPYADESSLICDYIRKKGYDRTAQILIDPASGCGHHGLGLREIPIHAYYDINPRAAVFCRINSILARAERMQSGLNDLRDGMPTLLKRLSATNVLVSINMPFAIFPKQDESKSVLVQDGGDRGVALTFAAFDAVKRWADAADQIEAMRLVQLFYSLGDGRTWEVVERAKQVFGRAVETVIFTGEKMWRVNGVKCQSNPMPLDKLRSKARCSHTYSVADQEAADRGYQQLEALYRQAGFNCLGYGLIDVLVKG